MARRLQLYQPSSRSQATHLAASTARYPPVLQEPTPRTAPAAARDGARGIGRSLWPFAPSLCPPERKTAGWDRALRARANRTLESRRSRCQGEADHPLLHEHHFLPQCHSQAKRQAVSKSLPVCSSCAALAADQGATPATTKIASRTARTSDIILTVARDAVWCAILGRNSAVAQGLKKLSYTMRKSITKRDVERDAQMRASPCAVPVNALRAGFAAPFRNDDICRHCDVG